MDERRWKTGENFPCKNKRITVWNYYNDLTCTQNQPIRSDNHQINKTMIKVKVIFGEKAVNEYENTGTIPDKQWLQDNGGVVEEKTFRTKEEYDAYVEGINDAHGWLDYHIFKPETVPNKTTPEPQKELKAFLFPVEMPRNTPDEEILRLWNDPDDDSVTVRTPDELAAALNDNAIGYTEYFVRFIMV